MRTTPTAEVVRLRRKARQAKRPQPRPSDFVTLEVPADAGAGIPCWSGGPGTWVSATVATAYDRRYTEIRPHMCSGGIARQTLLAIAAAMARTADTSTGRNCRASNAALATATGFPVRTVQRARECLRLLGVATEVLRGRQRTLGERMASWRMGDRHRGWASVWALHDDPQITVVIHSLSPHLERSPLNYEGSPSVGRTTTRGHASRARQGAAARRPSIDERGLALIRRWRQADRTPRWAYRFSEAAWAAMLAAPAAAGWTPADLNAVVTDWLAARPIPDNPRRPIALLGTILKRHTDANPLTARPTAHDEARRAAEAAAHAEHLAQQAADHHNHLQARRAAVAALAGSGRAAARAALTAARTRKHHTAPGGTR